MNVATLYQYFPNKQAVIFELFKRQSEARIQLGENLIAGASTADDWRKVIGSAIQAVAEARAEMPGAAALRQVMRSSPQLLEHEQHYSQHMSAALATELQAVGAKRDHAQLVARCAVETLAALLDLWSIETRGDDDRVVDEAKTLVLGYLAPYFEKRRDRTGPRAQRPLSRSRRPASAASLLRCTPDTSPGSAPASTTRHAGTDRRVPA